MDALILDRLQWDGRVTQSELATLVRRSVPAVSARIRRLESSGIILGYRAALHPARLKMGSAAFLWVTLRSRSMGYGFAQYVRRQAFVFEAHAVSDAPLFVLKLRTPSRRATEAAIEQIGSWPGVESVDVNILKETYKDVTGVPVRIAASESNGSPTTDSRTAQQNGEKF